VDLGGMISPKVDQVLTSAIVTLLAVASTG